MVRVRSIDGSSLLDQASPSALCCPTRSSIRPARPSVLTLSSCGPGSWSAPHERHIDGAGTALPQTPGFWVLMVLGARLGVFGAVAALLHGIDRVREQLVHAFGSGVVRRAVVVGGRHGERGSARPAAPADQASGQDPEPGRRSRAWTCRHAIGARDRGRLGRVVDRGRQLGAGARSIHGRRGRRVGLPATRAQR